MKSKKLVVLLLICVVLIVLSYMLYNNNMMEYIILTGTLLCVCLVLVFDELKKSVSSENSLYNDKINKLVKTYNPILISTNTFPNLKDKSILPVGKIDDLLDAQAEIREPIYYIRTDESTAFYIINDESLLVSFIKVNEDEESELEKDFKKAQQLAVNLDNIKDIDHTIIVNDKDKSFSISPLHKKNKKQEKQIEETEEKVESREDQIEVKEEEIKEVEDNKDTQVVEEEIEII